DRGSSSGPQHSILLADCLHRPRRLASPATSGGCMARLDLTVDPKSEYERKLMTAEQAAGLVESGDLIWIPSTHVPPAIMAVLATRESELRDVTIRSVSIPN